MSLIIKVSIVSKDIIKTALVQIKTNDIIRNPSINITYSFINFIYFFRCTGDGNCLYNAASIAVKGDESLSKVLRQAVSCELLKHFDYYCEHPHFNHLEENIKTRGKEGIFQLAFPDDVDNANLTAREKWSNLRQNTKLEIGDLAV